MVQHGFGKQSHHHAFLVPVDDFLHDHGMKGSRGHQNLSIVKIDRRKERYIFHVTILNLCTISRKFSSKDGVVAMAPYRRLSEERLVPC